MIREEQSAIIIVTIISYLRGVNLVHGGALLLCDPRLLPKPAAAMRCCSEDLPKSFALTSTKFSTHPGIIALMTSLDELFEAHVQEDSGFSKFEQYRAILRPPLASAPPASVSGRSTRRARPSTNEILRDKERDANWAQLWILALYLGIDDLYDVSGLHSWAAELEAPLLITDALTKKFSTLDTKAQQVALIIRIRSAWGIDFYRKLRLMAHAIFLSRTPSHGFLGQLAKLAGLQPLADFCETFPQWLVESIRNSNTPVAGLASHERGERQVGRADIADYLIFLTTRETSRNEAIHHCPRVTFNRSNSERRKVVRTDGGLVRGSHSSSSVEVARRTPLQCVEEQTRGADEELADLLNLDKHPPPPYSPRSGSLLHDNEP